MATTGRSVAARRRVVVVVTALAVAALVVGLSVVRLLAPDSAHRTPAAQLADGPTTGGAASIQLDVGSPGSGAVADCLGRGFATDPADVTVLYGVQQRTVSGEVPVLVLRNAAGELRLCDGFGPDSPAQVPVPTATAQRPVAFLSNGRRDWDCAPGSRDLRGFTITEWLSVAPQVDTVQLRFVVDGVAGPWFVTAAHDGVVHLTGWLHGPQPPSARVLVQHRILDAAGDPVAQRALPASQRLSGCAGGSAQIG
jgi:hypothetical protein